MGDGVIWIMAAADWVAPVAVAVGGGVLGVIGTVWAAMATGRWNARGAQEPTRAADYARMAEWQVRKRALYSDLLRAGWASTENLTSPELRANYLAVRATALLHANKDAAQAIRNLPEDLGSARTEQWDDLARVLHNDAEQPSHSY